MRTLRKKISFILIVTLLANLLLPIMGFAAENNNSVIPSELTNTSSEQILLSPDTTSWGNQTSTQESNANSQSNNNNEEKIANLLDKEIREAEFAWVPAMIIVAGRAMLQLSQVVTRYGRTTVVATRTVPHYNQFRDASYLRGHWVDHGWQYGPVSREGYLRIAQRLTNSTQSRDVLIKKRWNGDIVFYRISTNDFAVVSKDGYIRTLFKPNGGINYFNRQ
ncbi:MAG: hypothetical protein AB1815_07695 [Bacillota bacterium]